MDLQGSGLTTGLEISVVLIVIILVSLSVHEFAHALIANLYGDPTAKHEGRLTLNPLAHWDQIGTTLLVVLLFLRSFGLNIPVVGWGKPVPVNESNFENPRLHGLQTALAGPMSNLLLATILATILRLTELPAPVGFVLGLGVSINIFLMFFNLMPVPPLDGSRILRLFMSDQLYFTLATNPLFYFTFLFIIIFFLLDYIVIAANYLTVFLIGG